MPEPSAPPTTPSSDDELAIRRVVEAWALYRDAGDWERFATVWADDGWMTATWFQGPAAAFVEASRQGFESGTRISHLLSGSIVDVDGDRAIAQTKMTISQRGMIGDVEVDVDCFGRFYDFFARTAGGVWVIVRRQPIYERDRLSVLDPAAGLTLDRARLERYPIGYRHLAYLQTEAGHDVRLGLPGLTGPEVERLYGEGRGWLGGSPQPGDPR